MSHNRSLNLNIANNKSLIEVSKRRHCESVLHDWCVQEYQKEADLKAADRQKNELAAKKIVPVFVCYG